MSKRPLTGRAETDRAEVAEILSAGALGLTGRLVQASNATFYGEASLDGVSLACVYKPVRGERPLWDFPDGTLAGREVAAYAISELAGWSVVPTTVLADGPFGVGMLQVWIDGGEDQPDAVDVVPDGEVPEGWLHVLDAYDQRDRPVSLIHADDAGLRAMALFDIVVNNADRKGGHVLVDSGGRLYGCDHGVSLNVDPKLRTVLWGWAGEPLTDVETDRLRELRTTVDADPVREALCEHITAAECDALAARIDVLLRTGTLPLPSEYGPSIPWPAF